MKKKFPKITFLKGGVDDFSYFHWFSVILFFIHNHPCIIIVLSNFHIENFSTTSMPGNLSETFHIKMMFGSSLPQVVCGRAHVLLTLFVFICVWWCQHILCCVSVLFFIVLNTQCCQFLWIVHFWLTLRNSLTFIIY